MRVSPLPAVYHVAELCAASLPAMGAAPPAPEQPPPNVPPCLLCLRVLSALSESAEGAALLSADPLASPLQARGPVSSVRSTRIQFTETQLEARQSAAAALAAAVAARLRGLQAVPAPPPGAGEAAPPAPTATAGQVCDPAAAQLALEILGRAAGRHAGAASELARSGACATKELFFLCVACGFRLL